MDEFEAVCPKCGNILRIERIEKTLEDSGVNAEFTFEQYSLICPVATCRKELQLTITLSELK